MKYVEKVTHKGSAQKLGPSPGPGGSPPATQWANAAAVALGPPARFVGKTWPWGGRGEYTCILFSIVTVQHK